MSWNYAELSKLAKKAGGPEKLVNILIDSGKNKMKPWMIVAALGGSAFTLIVQKIIKYFRNKKKISDAEVEAAKKELIQGIKDYDAEQERLRKANAE